MHFASLAFKVEESANSFRLSPPRGRVGLEDFSQDADERKEGTGAVQVLRKSFAYGYLRAEINMGMMMHSLQGGVKSTLSSP